MLKSLRTVLLACGLLVLLTGSAMAVELNGEQWAASTKQEKLAFLYGAASVVAIEEVVGQKTADKPSIFVQKWVEAFSNEDGASLAAKLDKWYAEHPKDRNRHVFDVLWYEFMAPESKK